MPPTAGAIRAMRAFVELFADRSQLVRGLKLAEKDIRDFGKTIRTIGLKTFAAGSAIVTPLIGAAKLFGETGAAIGRMATITGVGVEALSALLAAAHDCGVEAESVQVGFRRMQKSIDDASTGNQTAREAFARLGLSVANLRDLSPDEQFRLIADRLSKVADPAARAALAMDLFGRSGTELLPLLSKGAAGIRKLEEEARKLGLTWTAADVTAAKDFRGALRTLQEVVERATTRLGAAVAPVLKRVADKITQIVGSVSLWIRAHEGLIVSALKVGAIVAAVGLGLMVLGEVFIKLAGAVHVAVVAAKVLHLVLGFTFSKVGLITIALGLVTAAILHFSGTGSKAIGWLKGKFGVLRDDAVEAFGGIRDALMAGDLPAAAQVMWALLKLEWTRGIQFLELAWFDFKSWFVGLGHDIAFGVTAAWQIIWHNLKVGWIETKAFLTKGWYDLKGLFDWRPQWQIEDDKRKVEREREASRADETTGYQEDLARLAREDQKARGDLAAQREAKISEQEKALEEAKRNLSARVADAKAKNRGLGDHWWNVDTWAEKSTPERDLGDAVQKVTAPGSFYAAQAAEFGGVGGALNRTATATERTARNTDELKRRPALSFA